MFFRWASAAAGVVVEVFGGGTLLHPLARTGALRLAEISIISALLFYVGALALAFLRVQPERSRTLNVVCRTHACARFGVQDKVSRAFRRFAFALACLFVQLLVLGAGDIGTAAPAGVFVKLLVARAGRWIICALALA